MLERDSTQAEVPMTVWGALSLEEMALNQLQQNKFLELMPVWLQVVSQGLRSGMALRLVDALKAALNLLTEISEQEPNIELLREGWRQVMGALANDDPNAALMLLSDEAWTHFTRLGIAQQPIDSPEKFIANNTLAQNKLNQNSQPKRRNI